MNINELLALLKIDLGIKKSVYDARLMALLNTAMKEIEREGYKPSLSDISDCNLIIMYAQWLWRKRDTMEAMPRMIRWQLNNRLFDRGDGNG